MKLRERIVGIMLLGGLAATPAFAQTRGTVFALRFGVVYPVIALIAGILILIFPRILNYVVAIYLIIIGIIGIVGR